MSGLFASTRADGKSNQQIIIDLVSDAAPGTVFTFADLSAALAAGGGRTYDRRDIGAAARLANHRLLREHRRHLRSVKGVGYRLAEANEHKLTADERSRKSQRQLKWALDTLENVRLDEMTEQERGVHLAQQEINAALYDQQRRILRRQADQGRLILTLTSRVEQIEGKRPN